MRIRLNRNYYYDNFIEDCFYLRDQYSDILKVEEIGKSYDNRSIMMLKVGRGNKNIILTGGVHGRETINTIVMMKMLETYCQLLLNRNNVDIHGLWKKKISDYLEKCSLYFIPLLNPDGYMISLQGFNVIQNKELRDHNISLNVPFSEWKYNGRGIDLNRNFPSVTWRSKSAIRNGDIYSGDFPGSELETKALIQVFETVKSIGYIDYHSRGKVIFYYRHVMPNEYNETQKELALDISKLTGYSLGNPEEEYEPDQVGGNTVHYYSEYIEKPAITIETVKDNANLPLNIKYQQETYYEIEKTPFIFNV